MLALVVTHSRRQMTRAFIPALTTTPFHRRNAAVLTPVTQEEELAELPTNDDLDLVKIRHSSAHVLGMAVQRLYPDAQVTVGPWIEHGFYYDFYRSNGEQFSSGDLKAIQKEMTKIIKKDLPIREEVVSREEAQRRIEEIGEKFKLEILDGIGQCRDHVF